MQLGTREIRHIILNNQVVNSSRALHSLKHTVPKSHKNIAIHMVDHIRRLGVFPANYALDLGEFIDSNIKLERIHHELASAAAVIQLQVRIDLSVHILSDPESLFDLVVVFH